MILMIFYVSLIYFFLIFRIFSCVFVCFVGNKIYFLRVYQIMSLTKIAVLISGNGTNLQALIDNIENGYIHSEIVLVISNKKNAYGLIRAEKHNIDNIFLSRKLCKNNIEFNRQIINECKKREVDLVILAGYLKILNQEFINTYENRIINIHPALIPSFCGKGFYGDRVHKAILDYGVKITGATVHFVDKGIDSGAIIIQESIKIDDNETIETLREKVMKIEHKILVEAVKLYCEDRIEVIGRKVRIK